MSESPSYNNTVWGGASRTVEYGVKFSDNKKDREHLKTAHNICNSNVVEQAS